MGSQVKWYPNITSENAGVKQNEARQKCLAKEVSTCMILQVSEGWVLLSCKGVSQSAE